MDNANTSFDMGFGWEPSPTLASALDKRGRRDVRVCLPYSLPRELKQRWKHKLRRKSRVGTSIYENRLSNRGPDPFRYNATSLISAS
jgi:hypothetical protein